MKINAIVWVGVSVLALGGLLLSLAGCRMPQWVYDDTSRNSAPKVAADLVYGYQVIHAGEAFPDIRLEAPRRYRDRKYLGLTSDAAFAVSHIRADLVMVEFLNVHCVPCQAQVPVFNNLYESIEADADSAGQIKIIGVAVGNSPAEIDLFREKYDIVFPIVADQQLKLHTAVGRPRLPFSVLVRVEERPEEAVAAIAYSDVEDARSLYRDMTALKTLDLSVLRKRGRQAGVETTVVEPPLPSAEIEMMVKSTMAELSPGSDGFVEFRKLALEEHHAYMGLLRGKQGIEKLFAEVVGRPTLCDVCHDVHFFYIFNEKGKVLDFIPLQVTKWGNRQWTRKDVELMRDRLVGRFIFTPFHFNPELDAVSSATITSAVIFDGMSGGQALFETLRRKDFI